MPPIHVYLAKVIDIYSYKYLFIDIMSDVCTTDSGMEDKIPLFGLF